ncbi:MAG: penicillin-binding protein 2 [Succinivibrionaceae bacterium]
MGFGKKDDLHQRVIFRDNAAESNLFKARITIALVMVILMTSALIINLYILQIVNHESFVSRSNSNRIKIIPIAPPRGLIYDRYGVLLAENQPLYELEVVPEELDRNQSVLNTLKELSALLDLNMDEKDIQNLVDRIRLGKKFKSIVVASKLSEEQVATFSVNQFKFLGFSVSPKLKRYYPYGSMLTHAIGYVARINQKDVEMLDQSGKSENYAATQDIGKLGVEKFYEDILHGKVGYKEVEVDSTGRIVRTLRFEPPVPGRDIYLTIDVKMQKKAMELLSEHKGAIVLINPVNGEILAFASNPSYDPNMFVRGILNKEYQELLNNPDRPLINRVSQGGYSPASTIKPLMTVMGLNEGIITPTTRFFGGPFYSLPGSTHKFRDWRKWGHGWMDVYRAIEISCDTFFYDLAFRTGIDNIHKYMSMFGFGQRSGIDIYEESLANLPSKEWKMARHRQVWVPGDTVPIGIGQGYWTTTLIQLARAHAILTQHGRNIIPHLALDYDDLSRQEMLINNKTAKLTQPEIAVKVKSPDYFDVGMKGMYLVVNGAEGTGRRAFAGTKYVAAGKSGTAQVITIKQDQHYNAAAIAKEHRDNALFVSFAPYPTPKALVGIILENAGGGSRFAAPLARELLDAYLLDPDHPQLQPEEQK